MKKHFLIISFIFLLVAFMTGQAAAIPIEYTMTGTATYMDFNSDIVFLNEETTGSFVLSDPDFVDYGAPWAIFFLSDLKFRGESHSFSGTGRIAANLNYNSGNDSYMYLNLEGFPENAWDRLTFYNYGDTGNEADSYAEQPDYFTFQAFACQDNVNCTDFLGPGSYKVTMVATRSSVPEPSTILLVASGFMGIAGLKRKRV